MKNRVHSFWRLAAILLAITTLLLTVLTGTFAVKSGYIENISSKMRGGGATISNPQYDAAITLFEEYCLQHADVVFLGDSIMARCDWSEFLVDTSVANRGIGSDTTEGVLNRLDDIVSLTPDTIFLMIGINDIAHNWESEAAENMESICRFLSEHLPDTMLYVLSVLPAQGDNISLEKIQTLNAAYKTICQFQNVTFLNYYPLFLGDDGTIDATLYSADGVHLNGHGYKLLYDEIKRLSL